ncbi:MAG: DUF885 domain-containing protein, partial [Bdellovibrionales bacterium]|nr:DUF885 domain-containing protein [Bdellovibrionales bacterium]
ILGKSFRRVSFSKGSQRLFALLLHATLVSCATSGPTPEQVKTETEKLNHYFQKTYELWVSRYPTYQTYLGLKTNYGKLDNYTLAYEKEDHEITQRHLKELKAFRYDWLTEAAQLNYRMYENRLKNSLERWKWRYYGYPINQMFGFQSELPSFLINSHSIENQQEAEAYISRLNEFPRAFSEFLQSYKESEKRKILPPHFVFEPARQQIKNMVTGAPFDKTNKESPLLEDFMRKVSALKISKKEKSELIRKAKDSLRTSVLSAYKDLDHYLAHLQKLTNKNHGVWALPEGEAYYNFRLRQATTTDLNAEQIHKIGLEEVKRIQEEMNKIREKVGYKGDLKSFFQHLKTDKQFYLSDTEKGRKEYLNKTQQLVSQMKQKLPSMFLTLPKTNLIVKPVESYRAKTTGIAFYEPPSMDAKRPGTFYVNLYSMKDVPLYKAEALTYHEAIPGHHMQIAIAKEMESLPMFRRTGGNNAFIEGWGLYAEYIPKEYGFYKDPYSDFGRLSLELLRACRLVVDSGIHYKKWSVQQAIDYMTQNTPDTKREIENEVKRYFVIPAQATTYKIGMLKILELRQSAQKTLGSQFNLREFHDLLLTNGPLPLSILEEQVDQWITRKKKMVL